MFYEVRISDASGKLKRKISSSELSVAFWKKIYDEDNKTTVASQKINKLTLNKKLKEMYPHLYEPVLNFNF